MAKIIHVEKTYNDIVDDITPAVEILQTLADLACAGNIHDKAQIDTNALASTLGVIIDMIEHALYPPEQLGQPQ